MTKKSKRPKHYGRWGAMKARCYNPNQMMYKYYGFRGIKVCDEWKNSFVSFNKWCEKTYEEGKTLDRIDVNGDYSPDNCKWSTPKEQQSNIRTNLNRSLNMTEVQKVSIERLKRFYGEPKNRVTKFCKRCGVFKNISEFNLWTSSRDKLSPYCSKHPR